MQIQSLILKNFRCFKDQEFLFDRKFVVIQGNNGVGKTSLLEALYYLCYLRSFRTSSGADLIGTTGEHFFLQVTAHPEFSKEVENCDPFVLQVGFSVDGKTIKHNNKIVHSHKELFGYYRVVSITEDDLELIKGAPEVRRLFLQQALYLLHPQHVVLLREYKKILQQRNALLFSQKGSLIGASDELAIWSSKLWELSVKLTALYTALLKDLEVCVNKLLKDFFITQDEQFLVSLSYVGKALSEEGFEAFWEQWKREKVREEFFLGRTLFGVHLDDFSIQFQSRKARLFASRGQQKLLVFLMKYAQFYLLGTQTEQSCLLLDDFLTDFDAQRLTQAFALLQNLNTQVFLTSPLNFEQLFPLGIDIQRILL
jgi:DNA replication and repair protein RecF